MGLISPGKYRLEASVDNTTWKTIMDETQISRDSSASQSSVSTKDDDYTRATTKTTTYSCTAYKNDTPLADTWTYEDVSGWWDAETNLYWRAGGIETGLKYESFRGTVSTLGWGSNNEDPGVSFTFGIATQGSPVTDNDRV